MTEEEQKAIELLKEEISRPVEVPEDKFNTFILYNIESAKTLLNLISNLQKENEELKNMSGIDVYKLGQKTQRDKTNFEIERLQKELDKSNKRINMCIDLLNGEGCLNYNTYEEKIKYIDKLIELESKE